jgi:hypothetical protein
MSGRFEPAHMTLAFSGGWVRILRSVVESFLLIDRRHDFCVGCCVTAQFVGDDGPWNVLKTLEQFAKDLLGRLRSTPEHGVRERLVGWSAHSPTMQSSQALMYDGQRKQRLARIAALLSGAPYPFRNYRLTPQQPYYRHFAEG